MAGIGGREGVRGMIKISVFIRQHSSAVYVGIMRYCNHGVCVRPTAVFLRPRQLLGMELDKSQ